MRASVLVGILFVALLAAIIIVIELVRIPGMYEVQGDGVIKYRPDAAHVNVGAYYEAATAADAVGEAATTMHNVLDALKAAGVADGDVESRGLSSGPKIASSSSSREQQPPGYYAEQNVVVTVRDVTQLGKLLNVVATAGSNSWSVNYFLTDPDKIAAQARKAAFNDALARADALAASGGFRRGAVLKIMDGQTQWPEADYYRRNYTNTDANVGRVEKVVVTGSRIPARRSFSVPPPEEESATASVNVLLEIK